MLFNNTFNTYKVFKNTLNIKYLKCLRIPNPPKTPRTSNIITKRKNFNHEIDIFKATFFVQSVLYVTNINLMFNWKSPRQKFFDSFRSIKFDFVINAVYDLDISAAEIQSYFITASVNFCIFLLFCIAQPVWYRSSNLTFKKRPSDSCFVLFNLCFILQRRTQTARKLIFFS